MQEFPHHLRSRRVARWRVMSIERCRLSILRSASPAELDGPGDPWPPETLLVAAVGECLIPMFRAGRLCFETPMNIAEGVRDPSPASLCAARARTRSTSHPDRRLVRHTASHLPL